MIVNVHLHINFWRQKDIYLYTTLNPYTYTISCNLLPHTVLIEVLISLKAST